MNVFPAKQLKTLAWLILLLGFCFSWSGSAQAEDAESELSPDSYTWTCAPEACPQFETKAGNTAYWRSPAQAGVYTFTVTVSDGSHMARQSLDVEVITGQGNIQVN